MAQPLLSICIPTYNRADVLDKTLSSILKNNVFRNDIEVIVSDNCSTDNTEEIVKRYTENNNNVKYFRNQENIGGEHNFIEVLSRGTGQFLKLHNDYLCFKPGGLEILYSIIDNNKDTKPFLFFTNGRLRPDAPEIFLSLNDVLVEIEHGLAWIGSYGFWKEQFDSLDNKEACIQTHFIQIDWFLRLFLREKSCRVYNDILTERVPFQEKQGGYHFLKIHLDFFLSMFTPYVKEGMISETTILILKRKILPIMLYWIVTLNIKKDKRYTYGYRGAFLILFRHYFRYFWFYIVVLKWLVKGNLFLIRKLFGRGKRFAIRIVGNLLTKSQP